MVFCYIMLLVVAISRNVSCLHLQDNNSRHIVGEYPMWQALVQKQQQQQQEKQDPTEEVPACVRCGARRAAAEARLSEPQLTSLRVELIKKQILQKLRLSEPPNVTLSMDELSLLLANSSITNQSKANLHKEEQLNDAEDFYGKTDQVILFPNGGKSKTKSKKS
jgi:cytochrome c553